MDECSNGCTVCVELPEELNGLDEGRKLYVALYDADRRTLDYRHAPNEAQIVLACKHRGIAVIINTLSGRNVDSI